MEKNFIIYSTSNLLRFRHLPLIKIVWHNQVKRHLKDTIPAILKTKKRGEKSGWKVRLRRLGTKTLLPAVLLASARSLNNQIDELSGLLGSYHLKNTAVLVITETWFKPGTSDAQVGATGITIRRADRTTQSGKAREGGIAIYINDSGSSNNVIPPPYAAMILNYSPLNVAHFGY